MQTIEPINADQQQQVVSATYGYIEQAAQRFNRSFDLISIQFDLIGRTAGMYRMLKGQRQIRYNPYIFAKYFADNLAVTVPHEVAHYITEQVYGLRKTKPHGREWQELMRAFDADASRTFDYDLTGIPMRKQTYHCYACTCTSHQLSSRRHQQICRGKARYVCRQCGDILVLSSNA